MSYYHILKYTDLPKIFLGRLACHSENCNRSVLYLYFPFQYNQFHVCEVSTWTGTCSVKSYIITWLWDSSPSNASHEAGIARIILGILCLY